MATTEQSTMSDTVREYAMIHLRASGPCTFDGLRGWLIDQVPGLTIEDSREATNTFIREAFDSGIIEMEENEDGVWIDLK